MKHYAFLNIYRRKCRCCDRVLKYTTLNHRPLVFNGRQMRRMGYSTVNDHKILGRPVEFDINAAGKDGYSRYAIPCGPLSRLADMARRLYYTVLGIRVRVERVIRYRSRGG